MPKQLDLKHKAVHILVTGRSGTGKTTFVEQEIRNTKHDKVFIFDPESEFGFRFGDSADVVTSVADMADNDDPALPKHQRIVIYDASADPDWQESFCLFCCFCYNFALEFPGRILMVIDELQEYVDDSHYPGEFADCIRRGRRYQLDMIYISSQPNLLHNSIRAQTTDSVAFAQSDGVAIKFNKELGFDAEAISLLPDLHFFRKRTGAPPKKGEIKFDKGV
jgi:hypothetical protein